MKNSPNGSFVNNVIQAFRNLLSTDLNTCRIGKITKIVDAEKGKVNVKPFGKVLFNGTEIEIAEIKNINLQTFGNKNFTISYELEVGDEVIILFCQDSISNWRLEGNSTLPDDPRTFDLSDAIALPGISNFKVKKLVDFTKNGIFTENGSIVFEDNGQVNINDGNLTIDV